MTDLILSIIVWIGVACNVLLGWLVYKKDSKNITNASFSVFANLSAVWGIGLFFYEHPLFLTSLFWLKLVYFVVLFMIGSLFFFSFVFPQAKGKVYLFPIIIYSLFSLVFVYTIVFTKLFVFDVVRETWGHRQILGPVYPIFGFWGSLFAIWAIVNFFRSYKKERGLAKAQLGFLFLGTYFFCIIPITLDAIFPILLKDSRFIWFSPISAAFFVGFVGYAIIKHRLMDIRFLAVRLASYILLVLTLGLSYTLSVFLLSNLLLPQIFSENYLLFTSVVASFIAFSFQPLRSFFEKATDKTFYKDRYETEDLLKVISQAMTSTINLKIIAQKLVEILCQKMKIGRASLISFEENDTYNIEAFYGKNSFKFEKDRVKELQEQRSILITSELQGGNIKKVLESQSISLIVPLQTEEKLVGCLLLGEKVSGDVYFTRDLEALEILAPQAAIAIQNAHAYEKIRQFSDTLKKEVERATRKLQKANIRLQELSSLKDEFVSIASHQLRTPMTSIKSYLWLALNKKGNKLNQNLRRYLERAYFSTERTINLVKDMLTVSRIEGKRLDLDIGKADLHEVAQRVYQEIKIKADEKKIKLVLERPKTEMLVKADQERIREVFQNLLDNAIKFTPLEGTVKTSFIRTSRGVETSVSDTGPGISEEDMPKLFQKFSRLEHSFSSLAENPGTGLGLYISKQIIGLHKGAIRVKSKVGRGSTFTFSLPRI